MDSPLFYLRHGHIGSLHLCYQPVMKKHIREHFDKIRDTPYVRKYERWGFSRELRHQTYNVVPIDLEAMPLSDLHRLARARTAFDLDSVLRLKPAETWMKKLFPTRPDGFMRACLRLRRMARLKLGYRVPPGPDFEALYRKLPRYTQWRRRFNVPATVQPGAEFKAKPPRWKEPTWPATGTYQQIYGEDT